ncbi:MAG: hypothetical protein HY539_03865 [Deltaproteobacteria bacterium]|nr:hypothetical protein [Deltaproteobacteria bacterium]
MPEAIKGWGDQTQLSLSWVAGAAGDELGIGKQKHRGITARVGYDLVDGRLTLAPYVSLTFARVSGTRKEISRGRSTFVPDDKRFGLGEPRVSSRSYLVEETGSVTRSAARGGLAVGWFLRASDDSASGVGLQAVFEAGPEILSANNVERHYPDQTVRLSGSDGLSMKAGAETLVLVGPASVGLGLLLGAYWLRSMNPVHHGSDNSGEVDIGLAAAF